MTKFAPTLLISQDDVRRVINMEAVLEIVELVFRAHGQGQVVMPPKITLDMRSMGIEGWHNAMPAYIHPLGVAGIKWAGGYARNPSTFGLPYVMGVIILQDPTTGYPLAVLDGTHITNLRTGAVAGVCAKYYGRQRAQVVTFVGAGTQARFALEAMMRTVNIMEVRVYDIDLEKAVVYAHDARRRYGVKAFACSSPQEAVDGADTVVTVTYADEPIVKGEWLKQGCTVLSMGSYQELDDDAVMSADKIVVDSWDQCAHRGELKRFAEAGRLTRKEIFAEIGETVAGIRPGRETDKERILVVPIGLGSHDIAVAKVVYDKIRLDGTHPSFRFF